MRARLALLLLLALSACGFQLRGVYTLPFDKLYIALPETNELRVALQRGIATGTRTQVVDNATGATATLHVVRDVSAKNILSIGSDGRVREFQLARTFAFRVQDREGRDLLPESSLAVIRDITFSDAAVLSKESEEVLLWRDIQNDLVQQILRRLAAAKVQARAD